MAEKVKDRRVRKSQESFKEAFGEMILKVPYQKITITALAKIADLNRKTFYSHYDTMEDLFVNFIGAVTFSVIGYFYIKHRGKGKLARAFIPTLSEQEEQDPAAPDSSRENSK